jgi:hypothetical protein
MDYPKSLKKFEFYSIIGLILFFIISLAFWNYSLLTYFINHTEIVPFIFLVCITGRLRENFVRWGALAIFIYSFSGYFFQIFSDIFQLETLARTSLIFPFIVFFFSFKQLFTPESNNWFMSGPSKLDNFFETIKQVRFNDISIQVKDVFITNVNEIIEHYVQIISKYNKPIKYIFIATLTSIFSFGGYSFYSYYKKAHTDFGYSDFIKARVESKGCKEYGAVLKEEGKVNFFQNEVVALTYSYSECGGGNAAFSELVLLDPKTSNVLANKTLNESYYSVQKITIQNQSLFLTYQTFKADDPRCCPSSINKTEITMLDNKLLDQSDLKIKSDKENEVKQAAESAKIALENAETERISKAKEFYLVAEAEKMPILAHPFYFEAARLGSDEAKGKLKDLYLLSLIHAETIIKEKGEKEIRMRYANATDDFNVCLIKEAEVSGLPEANIFLMKLFGTTDLSKASNFVRCNRYRERLESVAINELQSFKNIRNNKTITYPTDQIGFETTNDFKNSLNKHFSFSNWKGVIASDYGTIQYNPTTQVIYQPFTTRYNSLTGNRDKVSMIGIQSANHYYRIDISGLNFDNYKEGSVVEFSGEYTLNCLNGLQTNCDETILGKNISFAR